MSSLRLGVRAAAWMVGDLVPWQLLRALRSRDLDARITRAQAAFDAFEKEHDVHEGKSDVLKCSYCPVNDGVVCTLNCDCERRAYFRDNPEFPGEPDGLDWMLSWPPKTTSAAGAGAEPSPALSPQAGDNSPEGADLPPFPAPSGLTKDIAAVINRELLNHYHWHATHSSIGSAGHCKCGYRPPTLHEWRDHVAALIADALKPPVRVLDHQVGEGQ